MATEAGHIQISEFSRDVIPQINWMMEDLFCQYGVSIPYFMLDYDFPDYSERPDWVSGYNFNLDWGEWGYWLVWFNEMLGLLFDAAHLPRWQMPDLSLGSWGFYNDYVSELYDNMQRHYIYGQTGTFIKDEVIEGETSGITGWYKWIDGDGYIHIANKQNASGESVADFEDEKIVGADSGAYAWTYEDYWESPMQVYCGQDSVSMIAKRGESITSLEDSWDKYDAASVYTGGTGTVPHWGTVYNPPFDPVWKSQGKEGALFFDTTDAPDDATAITLNINISEIVDTFGTPELKIYRLDHVLDSSDWLAGGTLITSENLTETGLHSYSLDYADINVGGITRFKFSFATLEAQTKPSEASLQSMSWKSHISEQTYLEFTK